MKKFKKITSLALLIAMTVSALSLTNIFANNDYEIEQPPLEYMLISEQKTAVLNNLNISFNGAEAVEIQAYNIDGEDFVPIRAITQPLDIALKNATYEVSRTFYLYTPYELNERWARKMYSEDFLRTYTAKIELPIVADEKINVSLFKSNLVLDDSSNYAIVEAVDYYDMFIYNDLTYMKLNDLKNLSDAVYSNKMRDFDISVDFAITHNNDEPRLKGFEEFQIVKNEETNVTNVSIVRHDLMPKFYEMTGKSPIQDVETYVVPEVLEEVTTSNVSKNKVHETAPEVGKVYADIVVDTSKPMYLNNDSTNPSNAIDENFTEHYQDWNGYNNALAHVGQCSWYARGRFSETTGFKIPSVYSHLEEQNEHFINSNCTEIRDPKKIQAPAVAVWKGHALFIEYVEYDDNGNPLNVYFSEANLGNDLEGDPYRPGIDGIVQKMTFDDFINRSAKVFMGYIVPNDHI